MQKIVDGHVDETRVSAIEEALPIGDALAATATHLEVAKTHSRSHVLDDNPYSEAQFKTLKYRPDFPECFGSIEDARAHCQQFFHWYNGIHCHSGIGFMTPEAVHYGRAANTTLHPSTLNKCIPVSQSY